MDTSLGAARCLLAPIDFLEAVPASSRSGASHNKISQNRARFAVVTSAISAIFIDAKLGAESGSPLLAERRVSPHKNRETCFCSKTPALRQGDSGVSCAFALTTGRHAFYRCELVISCL